MDITGSKCCCRLSFINLISCPHCGKAFAPGTRKTKAIAEDKAFNRKGYVLFLAAFLMLPAALFLIQGYLLGSP